MSDAVSSPPSTALTAVALALLDVPFEPASPMTGELFDHALEHISDELLRAARGTHRRTETRAHPLLLPAEEPGQRRREQLLLRRNVAGGRHPAVAASLHEAHRACRQAVADLTGVRAQLPPGPAASVALACAALAGLARALDGYRRSILRIQDAVGAHDADRHRQAALATRAERDLLRRIQRTMSATYGVQERSVVSAL